MRRQLLAFRKVAKKRDTAPFTSTSLHFRLSFWNHNISIEEKIDTYITIKGDNGIKFVRGSKENREVIELLLSMAKILPSTKTKFRQKSMCSYGQKTNKKLTN